MYGVSRTTQQDRIQEQIEHSYSQLGFLKGELLLEIQSASCGADGDLCNIGSIHLASMDFLLTFLILQVIENTAEGLPTRSINSPEMQARTASCRAIIEKLLTLQLRKQA